MSNRERLHVRISKEQYTALKSYAESQGTSMSEVVDSALYEFFTPDEYKTVSLRFMTNLSHKMDVLLSREEATLETIGRFALIYLLHTPPLPEHEVEVAHTEGRARWKQFVEQISKSLQNNNTVLAALEKASSGFQKFYQNDDK